MAREIDFTKTPKKYIITERILDECIDILGAVCDNGSDGQKVTLTILNNIKDGKRPYRLDGVMNLEGFTSIKEDK